MVFGKELYLSFLFVLLASAADDKEYCGHTFTTDQFYAHTSYTVHATVVEVERMPRSDLIVHGSTNGEVIISHGYDTGTFERDATIITDGTGTQFCVSGMIFSADINGDSRDDLLCHKSSHDYSVRLYSISNGKYRDEEDLTAIPTCASGTKHTLIGDFDGNGADDIMCLDESSATLLAGGSFIYFNSACKTRAGYFAKRSHRYQRHWSQHKRLADHFCHTNLPKLYNFPAGSLTGLDLTSDTIIVADVGGNGRDDLVFLDANDSDNMKYFLSSGMTSSGVFRSVQVPTSSPTCDDIIISADVDGDNDDDIICVHPTADATARNDVSFYTSGDYASFVSATGSPCPSVCNHDSSTAALQFTVGDFNRDGCDDYMCRFDESGHHTGIYYSVAKP